MKTLIDRDTINSKVIEISQDINAYYMAFDWYYRSQEPVIVIGIMNGALFFMTDLIRHLSIRTKLDMISMSTYMNSIHPVHKSQILSFPKTNLEKSHILLVDCMLDTGQTISVAKENLLKLGAKDVRIAVLLRKKGKSPHYIVDEQRDFVGFDIEDEWVSGYGLDYKGMHREKPYITVWS